MELKAMSKSELEGFYKQACEEDRGFIVCRKRSL